MDHEDLRESDASATRSPENRVPASIERDDESLALRISKLAKQSNTGARYVLKGEIARGGMGAILKVFDTDLRRNLAMKVTLGHGDDQATAESTPVSSKILARFLEEAQVTGQLDHPGIVPVHELGLDPEGRVYFTMKLVKGRTLKDVFDELAAGEQASATRSNPCVRLARSPTQALFENATVS